MFTRSKKSLGAALAFAGAASVAGAQKPPAVRPLGPITRVSTEPLSSVSAAIPLTDGRVFVNDVATRRVLLFDSALAKSQVVADSTSATANAYGRRPGVLIAFRGDTALFLDPASRSMPVLSPAGKIARVMAMPSTGSPVPILLPALAGFPGIDAAGRLVFYQGPTPTPPDNSPGKHDATAPDSGLLLRFDLATRAIDTVATIKGPWSRIRTTRDDDGRLVSLEVTPDFLPRVDDWIVMPDGALAVVRGRDYHVDWLGRDGRWTSTPKMPFEWQHLDDAQKTIFIDSALAATRARRDSMMAQLAANPPVGAAGDGGRGGGRGGGGGGGPAGPPPAMLDGRPTLSDIPDYRPAFTRGSVRADADGNLWIRTTTLVKGQPAYDIVNRRGELVERIQIPAFRAIVGFGPGVVYMAVKDAAGVVHLERARIK
jgi:hypothetical protein